MHPLIVSAVTSTAGSFLDRWARGSGTTPAAKTPAPEFDAMLEARQATDASRPAEKSPADLRQERTLELRRQLFDAPELQAVLNTADPTKPGTLSLASDGRVMETRPGYGAKPLLLSPDTAEIARELASLSAAPGALPLSGPTGTSLAQARATGFDLTPRASFATVR